jgi:hypothetical protein
MLISSVDASSPFTNSQSSSPNSSGTATRSSTVTLPVTETLVVPPLLVYSRVPVMTASLSAMSIS